MGPGSYEPTTGSPSPSRQSTVRHAPSRRSARISVASFAGTTRRGPGTARCTGPDSRPTGSCWKGRQRATYHLTTWTDKNRGSPTRTGAGPGTSSGRNCCPSYTSGSASTTCGAGLTHWLRYIVWGYWWRTEDRVGSAPGQERGGRDWTLDADGLGPPRHGRRPELP